MIKKVNGHTPQFGRNCFLADNAVVVGDVVMGDECSVWFGAVVRGDVHYIRVGDRVNIQDGVVIHGTHRKAATNIGNDVTIGHNAIVHGCTIGDNVLLGMGSIVMDGCVVETGAIVAAGAVLPQGTRVESGTVYAGVPAKKIKEMDPELLQQKTASSAASYLTYAQWYRQGEEGDEG